MKIIINLLILAFDIVSLFLPKSDYYENFSSSH